MAAVDWPTFYNIKLNDMSEVNQTSGIDVHRQVDYSSPAGDIASLHAASFEEALFIANKYCNSDNVIDIYGTDCNTVWIKDKSRSGPPKRDAKRISFVSLLLAAKESQYEKQDRERFAELDTQDRERLEHLKPFGFTKLETVCVLDARFACFASHFYDSFDVDDSSHLTLFGTPAVNAGVLLIGKALNLRSPFVQVMEERVLENLKEFHVLKLSHLETTVKLDKTLRHVSVLERVLTPWVVLIQSCIRMWIDKKFVSKVRCMGRLTTAHRKALTSLIAHWRANSYFKYKFNRVGYDDDYGYGDYEDWY